MYVFSAQEHWIVTWHGDNKDARIIPRCNCIHVAWWSNVCRQTLVGNNQCKSISKSVIYSTAKPISTDTFDGPYFLSHIQCNLFRSPPYNHSPCPRRTLKDANPAPQIPQPPASALHVALSLPDWQHYSLKNQMNMRHSPCYHRWPSHRLKHNLVYSERPAAIRYWSTFKRNRKDHQVRV